MLTQLKLQVVSEPRIDGRCAMRLGGDHSESADGLEGVPVERGGGRELRGARRGSRRQVVDPRQQAKRHRRVPHDEYPSCGEHCERRGRQRPPVGLREHDDRRCLEIAALEDVGLEQSPVELIQMLADLAAMRPSPTTRTLRSSGGASSNSSSRTGHGAQRHSAAPACAITLGPPPPSALPSRHTTSCALASRAEVDDRPALGDRRARPAPVHAARLSWPPRRSSAEEVACALHPLRELVGTRARELFELVLVPPDQPLELPEPDRDLAALAFGRPPPPPASASMPRRRPAPRAAPALRHLRQRCCEGGRGVVCRRPPTHALDRHPPTAAAAASGRAPRGRAPPPSHPSSSNPTTSPFSPCRITSSWPVKGVTTHGTPTWHASTSGSGSPSTRESLSRTSCRAYCSRISSG